VKTKSIDIEKIPVIQQLIAFLKAIKLPFLQGISLHELLNFYISGLITGALSYRAAAVSWSFFMALFPFALFILNLIPYIPIQGFQEDFLGFVAQAVPPNTYGAIENIVDDILNNSNSGLVSWGFILSIYLMTNGVNAIMSGFETSQHIVVKRPYFRQYFVALCISFLLTLILILSVSAIIISEVLIQKTIFQDLLESKISDRISLIQTSRYIFALIMIIFTIAVLFKYGIKQTRKKSFITVGTIFTTVLIIIMSYFFGIWVVKFSKYNELYGSIGTLLIVMFYLWINCMILLLGFELDASIAKLKRYPEQNPKII
jgi:membrane protein